MHCDGEFGSSTSSWPSSAGFTFFRVCRLLRSHHEARLVPVFRSPPGRLPGEPGTYPIRACFLGKGPHSLAAQREIARLRCRLCARKGWFDPGAPLQAIANATSRISSGIGQFVRGQWAASRARVDRRGHRCAAGFLDVGLVSHCLSALPANGPSNAARSHDAGNLDQVGRQAKGAKRGEHKDRRSGLRDFQLNSWPYVGRQQLVRALRAG